MCEPRSKAGETRHSNDINVSEVQFLGQRDSGGGDAVEAAVAAGHVVDDDLDDLPF